MTKINSNRTPLDQSQGVLPGARGPYVRFVSNVKEKRKQSLLNHKWQTNGILGGLQYWLNAITAFLALSDGWRRGKGQGLRLAGKTVKQPLTHGPASSSDASVLPRPLVRHLTGCSEQRGKSLGSGCLRPTTYRVPRQDAELCLRLPSWATFSTTSRQHHGALICWPPGNWAGAIYGCEVMIIEALFSPINVEKLTMKEDFV